ncbi:MAG: HerA helicase [Candidatus Bathyarchaeota archaeon B63]|nr:MAG: HerA helicase [Candidatus Bathyarchaeota archaeon B63]
MDEPQVRPVGYALSGCTHDSLVFVVMEDVQVRVNHFYFIEHPAVRDAWVLVRTYRMQPYNPEMITGRTGPLAGKKGRRAEYGKRLEYTVAFAEILGYYDEKGKWRMMEVAPSPWDIVYEPSEEALRRFFIPEIRESDVLLLEIGKARGTNIPVYIDLNSIAKGHMFVAGMTRSGKSSFIINMVAKASRLRPRPHFVIFDIRGEYNSLKRYGAKVLPYTKFTPGISDPAAIADKLELRGRERSLLIDAVRSLQNEGAEISRDNILIKIEEILEKGVVYKTRKSQEKALIGIEWFLENKGAFIDERVEPLDIVTEIKKNFVLIIDFSVNADIEAQQRTAKYILDNVRRYAMERKDYGDFACIISIEEAQYFAPERGSEMRESAAQSGVKASMIETASQAGGYNVGLILLTQRPAYVLKSVISQCNSVACFRLKSGNDQDAILQYTEYGSERLRDYLPGLADHEAMLWGLAVPTPFPVIAEIEVEEYPQKAVAFAKTAWEKMEQTTSPEARRAPGLPLHLRDA